MADDTTTPNADPAMEPAPPEDLLGEAGKKALDAERKARRAAERLAEQQAARLKELEDRDKSETQKASDRAAELERLMSERDSEIARLRIAHRHGVAEEDMELLGTGTEEQIEARAKRLAELRGAAQPAAPASPFGSRPVEQLRPGATPSQPDQPNPHSAMNQWIRSGVGLNPE